MKKIIFTTAVIALCLGTTNAQISQGGVPRSIAKNAIVNIPTIDIAPVDHEARLAEMERKEDFGPYMVSSIIPTSIRFQQGTIVKHEDGTFSCNISIQVPNSKGIGLYLEDFYLPQGVKMYIYNSNKKHILGAFTSEINNESKIIVTEPIQGTVANIELNIEREELLSQISFHIYKVASYFRGFDELTYFSDDYTDYETLDVYDNALFGGSSRCMINAVCPQGENFVNQRNATMQVISVFGGSMGGLCSATMINGLGNIGGTCDKFLLTASHCSNNSTETQNYNEWLLRYNYQQTTCNRTNVIPNAKSTSGATFLARSSYNSATSPSLMKGDFLLLKVTSLIPTSWNVALAGWNSNSSITMGYIGDKKFIGFHHPGGDIKKLSIGKSILTESVGAGGTHWWAQFTEGYGAQGSSGSGYFNNEGQLIGIASLAPSDASDSCKVTPSGSEASSTATGVLYSKLSYDWENSGDGGASAPDNRKLRPWLDPANSGGKTASVVSSTCAPLSIATPVNIGIKGDFVLYPNPLNMGNTIQMKMAMEQPTDMSVSIYDIQGRLVQEANFANVSSEIINLNIANLTNGIYMIKCANDFGYLTKRIVVNR